MEELQLNSLKARAEEGDTEAQFDIGMRYYLGDGTPQDMPRAAEWFERAANGGHTGACFRLGCCCKNGEGLERDYFRAAKLFKSCADEGGVWGDAAKEALENLLAGGMSELFAEMYLKSAEAGDAQSQFITGEIRYIAEAAYVGAFGGEGYKADFSEAVKWYKKAAAQGHAQAAEALQKLSY